jgi:hypothetical protein
LGGSSPVGKRSTAEITVPLRTYGTSVVTQQQIVQTGAVNA